MSTFYRFNFDGSASNLKRFNEPQAIPYEFVQPNMDWETIPRVFLKVPYRENQEGGSVEKDLYIPKPIFDQWVARSTSTATLETRVAKLEKDLLWTTGGAIALITAPALITLHQALKLQALVNYLKDDENEVVEGA